MTTGVPAPIISLASRLLLLSLFSRETGFALVVARAPAAKETGLRSLRRCGGNAEGSWMPDEDSNLD